MKPIHCLLGLHDWSSILPGQKIVNYKGKEWWPMSGIRSCVCRRCGKIRNGVLLIPAGWDGDPVITGRSEIE
jgi:hypothetical protein